MGAAGDLEARRRRREAIGTLSGADHYPAQLHELLHALAPIDGDDRSLPRKARGLLHLVACPPPGQGARLDRKIYKGRSFIELLDACVFRTDVEILELPESDRLVDPLTALPRAEIRRLLLEAVAQL